MHWLFIIRSQTGQRQKPSDVYEPDYLFDNFHITNLRTLWVMLPMLSCVGRRKRRKLLEYNSSTVGYKWPAWLPLTCLPACGFPPYRIAWNEHLRRPIASFITRSHAHPLACFCFNTRTFRTPVQQSVHLPINSNTQRLPSIHAMWYQCRPSWNSVLVFGLAVLGGAFHLKIPRCFVCVIQFTISCSYLIACIRVTSGDILQVDLTEVVKRHRLRWPGHLIPWSCLPCVRLNNSQKCAVCDQLAAGRLIRIPV